MSNRISKVTAVAIFSSALFLSNCSNNNNSINPFDVTDLQADAGLVGTWEAEWIIDVSNLALSSLPPDSETSIIMKLNADKTVEFTNHDGTIQETGTWGTGSDKILVINRPTDKTSTNYNTISTDSGDHTLVFSLYFQQNTDKPFMVPVWTKMQQ